MQIFNTDKPDQIAPYLYFLHIPKTAGTSLRYFLKDYFDVGDWMPCNILDQVDQLDRAEINQYRFLSGHFSYKILDYLDQSPLVITWLREPVAREISHYYFNRNNFEQLKTIALNNNRHSWVRHYEQFQQYSLAELCQRDTVVGFTDNHQTRYLSGCYPAEGYLAVDEQMLEKAKANLVELFHFGLCESMTTSIDMLCHRLAFPRRNLSFSLNQNKSGKKRSNELPEQDIEIIRQANRFDVELYDFAQQEFHRRLQTFWHLAQGGDGIQQSCSAEQILASYDAPDNVARLESFLRRNFERKRGSQSAKVRDVSIDFSDGAFINGWHPRFEVGEGRFIRWAGPTRESMVLAPLESGFDYDISFEICKCPNFDVVKHMKLSVGSQLIPLAWEKIKENGVETNRLLMRGTIPQSAIDANQSHTEITIVTSATYEQESPFFKSRQVSFATDKIHLRAA